MKTVLFRVNCSTVEKRCLFCFAYALNQKTCLRLHFFCSVLLVVHRHLWICSLDCRCLLPLAFQSKNKYDGFYRWWILNLNVDFIAIFFFFLRLQKNTTHCAAITRSQCFFPFFGKAKLPLNNLELRSNHIYTFSPRAFGLHFSWVRREKNEPQFIHGQLRIQTNDQFRCNSRSQA